MDLQEHRPVEIEVAAGLVFRGGKLLLTQRPAGGHLEGLWEFPGGKREPGETYVACLKRELREELGTEVRVGRLIEALTHDYPERRVHLRFFRCSWLKNEPQPLGCQRLVWVSSEDLRSYPFPAADARLIDRLEQEPGLWGRSRPGRSSRMAGAGGRNPTSARRPAG